jgi:RNA polymerase sigma-70 factor (ECF subfamily)
MPRTLDEAAREAAGAWPGIALDAATFAAYVREKAADVPVDELHVADLFLACACVRGDRRAWNELARRYLVRVPEYVARVDRSPAFADEIRQRLAVRLSGSDATGSAKIALYTGRGALAAWIRVAAIREAQHAKRGGRRQASPEEAMQVAAPGDDPEIRLVKKKYAADFRKAFEDVLRTLSSDERNVLKLHYLDGLTIDEVGKAYRVSRATAARWLASARENIVQRVRESLGARLDARLSDTARMKSSARNAPSPESMLAFVRSQLDLSLRRHFDDSKK